DHAYGRQLVGRVAGDVPVLEAHGTAGGRDGPRDQVEQGGLAGAVGPQDGVDGVLPDMQRHIGHCLQATEVAGQALSLQDHDSPRSLRCARRSRKGWSSPKMPPGAAMTITTNKAPK